MRGKRFTEEQIITVLNGECGTQEAKQKDGRCLSPATRVSLGAPESP
jgi:hypothetical protein